MKKFFAFLAAMLLSCSATVLAEMTLDTAAMTDDQLLGIINACQSELADRNSKMDELLYQNDELGITLKMTGFRFKYGNMALMGALINRGDKAVRVYVEDSTIYVNNWTVTCYSNVMIEAEAGRNARSEIFEALNLEESADVSGIAQLVTVEGVLIVEADGERIGSIPLVVTSFSGLE